MQARLILIGKKAGLPDVRAAVQNSRSAGHDVEVRVTWERRDAARLIAEAAREGEQRPIDVGRCSDSFFTNVAAGGIGAAVTAETPVELKNVLEGNAFTLMGLVPAVHFVPYARSIRSPGGEPAAIFQVLSAECPLMVTR